MADIEETLPTNLGERPLNIPLIPTSNFNIQATSNDFYIVLGDIGHFLDEGGALSPNGKIILKAIVKISPQSAKDLVSLLSGVVDNYEQKYGEITTDYVRSKR